MGAQLYTHDVREFGTLASSIESTDMGGRLQRAINTLLRPTGAIKGIPKYVRLWATFESETAATKIRSLPFTGYPSGVGVDGAARTANKTVLVRVYRQGKNFILFYDLTQSKARGLFYGGDDGSFTSGDYDFSAGTPTWEVLAVGFDANARWYGKRTATQLMLSNNASTDTPGIFQLGRTATPGKWRSAGSNAQPATPVISRATPAGTSNVQARWALPGSAGSAAFMFLPVVATDYVYSYTASATCVVSASANTLAVSGFLPTEGMAVLLVATSAPAGLTNNTLYYCKSVSGTTTSLAATAGGAAIDITTAGSGVVLYQLFGHGYSDAQAVTLTTSGTLPSPLATATTYYMRDVSTNVFFFKLAATVGGAAINLTTAGSGTQSIVPTGTAVRAGTATLTFTADATNFPGSGGNNRIQVAIQQSAYATSISSTLSGTGTTSNPYLYTIITGSTAPINSTDAVVAYVNADTRVVGILEAAKSAADATSDAGSYGPAFLSGGLGAGTSEGLTSQTCTVYLRYFDSGTERLGYEGISSDISNTIILDESTRSDILVTITPDPAAEGGRFDLIRVYFQFGEGTAAVWSFVGEVANTSGTKTLQVGTNTEIGSAMSVDQNRPLPYKDVVMVGGQTWFGGGLDNPDLLYVSKNATDDEICPEGAYSQEPELVSLARQTSRLRVTALYTDDYRLHVHTNNGVILLNPSDPTADKHIPQVTVGALNPACITDYENSKIFFLGSDLQIYEFSGARYGRRNIAASTKDAIEYILDIANIDRIGQQPDRVNTYIDLRSEIYWYSFPGQDNTLTSFAFDFQNNGVVGEFTYPKVFCVAKMEAERPETVFCDEDGNLFFMDSRQQNDSGDELSSSSAYTPHAIIDPIPVQYAGYGYVDRGGFRYYQAYQAVIETGFIDLGRLSSFKQFTGLLFSTIKNSRAWVDIELINKSGFSVTRTIDDLYSTGTQQLRKIMCQLGGEAVKIRFTITSAEQSPWVIRNLSLLYRSAGQL
jgi:hypothetical protein